MPVAESVRVERSLAELPGPAGLPLLGNAHQLDVARLHQVFEAWAAEFGPLYRYSLAGTPFLVVSDPALVNEVLRRRPDEYRKISSFETIFAELGLDGVFVAEGDAWRSQRRLVMQALESRHVENFFPLLRQVIGGLERRWQDAARTGREVDLVDEFTRFTVDVTTRLALATETNTIDGEQGELLGSLAPIFPALARRLNAAFPWWRYLRLPADREVDRARVHLEGWLGEVIEETRALLAADPARAQRPANFLEAMLLARDESGAPFAEKVIFANALTMLLAGEDTTANTLGWALHLLLDEPAEIEVLRAQFDAVLGGDAVAGDLATLERLTAIDAVANETMRLKPVAPFFLMENCKATVLGDVRLPAGTSLCLLTRVAGLDPARVTDPLVFRPARWAGEGLLSELQRTGVFVPFGSGPRSCPGRSFAHLLIRYALSTLLHGFEVERVGASSEVREQFGFVMTPAGLRVRLRIRDRLAAHGRSGLPAGSS
ncbi:MAG: cytochrome P450 [Deltaproteobacteria bacterium]